MSQRPVRCGEIALNNGCFMAGNTNNEAAQRQRICLEDVPKCQDNAYLLADTANLYVGNGVSIAHQTIIENSVVEDD